MERTKVFSRNELFSFFVIGVLFLLIIFFEADNSLLTGLYLFLLALFFLPVFPWFRKWWIPLTLGFIILLPGPLDRSLLSVQLTPEVGVNPIGLVSVIDLLMFFSILLKFRGENKLSRIFDVRINYVTLTLLLITLVSVFSAVLSYFNYYTFYLPMALRAIFYSIRFLLVFAWVKNFFNDFKLTSKLPLAIHLITLGFVLLVLLSPAEAQEEGENRLSVATYGLNTFGHLLTFTSLLCVPFISYHLKQRQTRKFLLIFACFLTCLAFLLMSGNRMSFGLFIMGVGSYNLLMPAPFRKKLRLALIFILVFAIAVTLFFFLKPDLFNRVFGIFQLFSGENALDDIKELQARFVVWSISYEMILSHPVFGIGPGQWNYVKHLFGTMPPWMTTILDPHNGYLLYASEMGLLCMVLYYSIILSAVRRGFKAFRILKKQYALTPTTELSLYLSFVLILCIVIGCWLISDFTNASGLNIRVQSLMWSLCSLLYISPVLTKQFIENKYES